MVKIVVLFFALHFAEVIPICIPAKTLSGRVGVQNCPGPLVAVFTFAPQFSKFGIRLATWVTFTYTFVLPRDHIILCGVFAYFGLPISLSCSKQLLEQLLRASVLAFE